MELHHERTVDLQEIAMARLILAWGFVIYSRVTGAVVTVLVIPCALAIVLYRRLRCQKSQLV